MKKPAPKKNAAPKNDQQSKLMELLKQKRQQKSGGFGNKASGEETSSGKPPRGVKTQIWNRKSGM